MYRFELKNIGTLRIYKKKKNDLNIIPTYFNPFIKKNVNIYYEKSHKKLILFKGDADGDRPRI